jgi:methyl-accepting chemotaxis protein
MFKSMKIGLRMGLGFGVVIVLMIAMGLFAMDRLGAMDQGTNKLVNDRWPKTVVSNEIVKALDDAVISVSTAILQDDAAEVKKELQYTAHLRADTTKKIEELTRTIKTEEGKAALKAVVDSRSKYGGALDEVIRLIESGEKNQAKAIVLGRLRPLCVGYSNAVGNLVNVVGKLVEQGGKEAEESFHLARTMIIIALSGSIALALFIIFFVTRSITKPLSEAVAINNKLAEGDLSVTVNVDRSDEVGQLLAAMKNMVDKLKQIMGDINMLSDAAVHGKLAARADVSKHAGDYQKIVQGINDTLDAVISPLNVSAEYVDRISKGDIPPKITDEYKGDFNEIKNNLNSCIDAVKALVADANALEFAAVEGKLATRADASKHQGEFRTIVEGVNNTLDAVIGPLNVAAEYVDRISKGDIPPKITDEYNGDFNEIKNNLNNCIDGLGGVVECNAVLKRMALNDHTRKVEGEYVGLFASVSEATNLVRTRLLAITRMFANLSMGDTSDLAEYEKIGKRSDEDVIIPAIIKCMQNINLLIEDMTALSSAAVEGDLAKRTDAAKHNGGYRKIAEGVNNTLDAVVGPLKMAASYMDQISKGEIPPKITEEYKGDFNEIKNNLNNCIDGLGGLVECNAVLKRMAFNDHTKKVEGEYVGLFASVSEATNLMRERLLAITRTFTDLSMGDTSDLAEYEKVGKRSDEDVIVPAMIKCMQNINLLIEDMTALSNAAVEGDLAKRADAGKHHGGYRKVVEGVNDTLDAVIGPLQVAASYVDQISKGTIPPKITTEYKGQYNLIKNNLHMLIDAMEEVTTTAEEIASGNLTVKIKERSAQDKLMQAMANMVGSLTEVASNIQTVANQVMTGSQEMSASSEQLSQGATEQSAAVEEVSSSMEQMAANIKQNSDNAQQTERIALKAATDGRDGGKSVSETVAAMKEIASKISIIEEIARQTNLLALNAAIEAARAGEHGKGFAVVASEVRKLAERSQTAAAEINKLSASSVQIAEKAGEMLARMVPDIQKNADLVQEITAASNEQSAGAAQINKAVQQLDQVVQQNASASEEMASTATELLSQAEQLQSTIAFFKLDGGSAVAKTGIAPAVKQAKAAHRSHAAHLKHAAPKKTNGGAQPSGVSLNLSNEVKTDMTDEEFERY